MPSIEDEFETLAVDFVDTFARSAMVTLTRNARGSYNASTMARALTPTTLSAPAVRSALRQETINTGPGAPAGVEEVMYTMKLADLSNVPPAIGDTITDPNVTEGGSAKVYRIVAVDRECADTLARCRCRQDKGGV